MIVFDTNILSELMRPAPQAAVEQWLADQPEASVFISAITEAELRYGAKIMAPGKRQAALAAEIEGMIGEDFGNNIFDSVSIPAHSYQCGAGSAPPYLSEPSPGCPVPGDSAQLLSSTTKQFWLFGMPLLGETLVADIAPPPIWNFCHSNSPNLLASEFPLKISTPDDDPPRPILVSALAWDRSKNLPIIPAFWNALIRSLANSLASIDGLISAMLMRWNFPTRKSATNIGQFTYKDLGKTARSTRSSRQRSLAVSRRSPKRRSSVMAAFRLCLAMILPLNSLVLNCVNISEASATTSSKAANAPPSSVHQLPSLCQNSLTCRYSTKQQKITEASATYPAFSQNESDVSSCSREIARIMTKYADYEKL